MNDATIAVEPGVRFCRECRGVGHFTLQSRERSDRTRVACPVCHGTALEPVPERGAVAPPSFAFDAMSADGRKPNLPR